ncbi:hypothetical protein [Skermanella stibiiresistens]|uniref:hypothetical protein n=1 Tax=Skermanella stibiiresistens TaxID=913326 RepID=UPI0012FAD5C1|nr:hypothetical protein [Skermanella stibiiresistens]
MTLWQVWNFAHMSMSKGLKAVPIYFTRIFLKAACGMLISVILGNGILLYHCMNNSIPFIDAFRSIGPYMSFIAALFVGLLIILSACISAPTVFVQISDRDAYLSYLGQQLIFSNFWLRKIEMYIRMSGASLLFYTFSMIFFFYELDFPAFGRNIFFLIFMILTIFIISTLGRFTWCIYHNYRVSDVSSEIRPKMDFLHTFYFHNFMSIFWFLLVGLLALRALAHHYPDVDEQSAIILLGLTSIIIIFIHFLMEPTGAKKPLPLWLPPVLFTMTLLFVFPGFGQFSTSALRAYNAGGGLPILITFDKQKQVPCSLNDLTTQEAASCYVTGFYSSFSIYPLKLLTSDHVYVGKPIIEDGYSPKLNDTVFEKMGKKPEVLTIVINRDSINGIIFLKPEKVSRKID